MYDPSGPSCMRWNIREFLKIKFIGVSSWQRSVSGEHRLCRANLHRHLDGRAHPRLTRDSPEDGIVSKRMPADLPNCGPYRSRPQMTLQDVLLPSGSARAVCEDPVLRAFVQAVLVQLYQRCSNARINWKSFTRGFGLGITSLAVDNTSPNEDREIFPVEVAPLQAHDFAGAKAQTY